MSGVVRPLTARVIRQEHAARNVSQMLDALPAAERPGSADATPGVSRHFDPEAYDESGPALFVYRLRRGGEEHLGVVADVRAEAFVDGQVRGHEAVQPDRVAGLVEHFASVAVRSELVALLHESGPALDAAVATTLLTSPLVAFTGRGEWEQTVWRVPESVSGDLCEELGSAVHYIADGHHRVAASLREWQRAGRPDDAGLMCVIFPLDGLRLLAFHRRVSGPVDGDGLLRLLSRRFEVSEVAGPQDASGSFALYTGRRWWDAAWTGSREPGAAGLDVALLDEHVLGPLLDEERPGSARVEIASALTPLDDLRTACDEDGGALFVLRPPALRQLTEVADRGEVMPPKTTYFDPKPSAGIFLR